MSEAEALDHVAGYCVINDVSERAFQAERSGQWTKGKSCDTFGPTGPWLVTKDECRPAEPEDVAEVNGQSMQNGSTADHGLRRRPSWSPTSPVHEPASRRHHLDRHAARRRPGA
jgi:fumarylacetoacetate (FAA) hydrolase family protein